MKRRNFLSGLLAGAAVAKTTGVRALTPVVAESAKLTGKTIRIRRIATGVACGGELFVRDPDSCIIPEQKVMDEWVKQITTRIG